MGLRNASSYEDVLVDKIRRMVHTALERINKHDELEHVEELWPRQQRDAWRERHRQQQRQELDDEREQDRSQPTASGSRTDATTASRQRGGIASLSRTYAQAAGHFNDDDESFRPLSDYAPVTGPRADRSPSGSSTDTDDTLRGDRDAQRRSDDALRQRFHYTFEQFVEHLNPDASFMADLVEILVGETARRAISRATQVTSPNPIGDTDFATHVIDSNRRAAEERRLSSYRTREASRVAALHSEIARIAQRARRGPRPTSRDGGMMQREEPTTTANAIFPWPPPRTISTRTLYSTYGLSDYRNPVDTYQDAYQAMSEEPRAGGSDVARAGTVTDPSTWAMTTPGTPLGDTADTLRSARVGLRSMNSNAARRGEASTQPSSNSATARVRSELQALRRRLEMTEDRLSFQTRRAQDLLHSVSSPQTSNGGEGQSGGEQQSAAATGETASSNDVTNSAQASSLVRRFLQQPFPSDARTAASGGMASGSVQASPGQNEASSDESPRAREFANHARSQRHRLRMRRAEASESEAAASASTIAISHTDLVNGASSAGILRSEATLMRAQRIMRQAEQVNRDARQTLEQAYSTIRDAGRGESQTISGVVESASSSSATAGQASEQTQTQNRRDEDASLLRHVVGDGPVGQAMRGSDLPLARLPARARDGSAAPVASVAATQTPPPPASAPTARLSQSPQRQEIVARR